ncbi:hypothetical protein BC829DRAFT_58456 [Chytridium lagenaria]|nr:hypothetical protein BC829DRAFT_58456 [Chytridium lagenaria]
MLANPSISSSLNLLLFLAQVSYDICAVDTSFYCSSFKSARSRIISRASFLRRSFIIAPVFLSSSTSVYTPVSSNSIHPLPPLPFTANPQSPTKQTKSGE